MSGCEPHVLKLMFSSVRSLARRVAKSRHHLQMSQPPLFTISPCRVRVALTWMFHGAIRQVHLVSPNLVWDVADRILRWPVLLDVHGNIAAGRTDHPDALVSLPSLTAVNCGGAETGNENNCKLDLSYFLQFVHEITKFLLNQFRLLHIDNIVNWTHSFIIIKGLLP